MINYERLESLKKQEGWTDLIEYLYDEAKKELNFATAENADELSITRHLAKYKKVKELVNALISKRA